MSKYIMFFAFCFLGLSLISGIGEKLFFGSGESARLDILMQPNIAIASGDIIGAIASMFTSTYLSNLWAMMWFDYAIFQGWMIIFRYFCWIFPIGFIFSLILSLVNRTSP